MDLDFEDLMDVEDDSFHELEYSGGDFNAASITPSSEPLAPLSTPHTRHVDIAMPPRITCNPAGAGAIIAKLEDILETVVDCMLAEKPLVIHLKTRSTGTRQILDPVTGVLKNEGSPDARKISWPGKSQREAWKFCELPCRPRDASAKTSN